MPMRTIQCWTGFAEPRPEGSGTAGA